MGLVAIKGNHLQVKGITYEMGIPDDKIRFFDSGYGVLDRDILVNTDGLVYRIDLLVNRNKEYAVYSCTITPGKSNNTEECLSRATLKICSSLDDCKKDIKSKTYSRKKSGYSSILNDTDKPKNTDESKPIKKESETKAIVDTGINILKRASLNYFDPKENKNKFYIMELQDLKDGNYCVCGTYGRVGTNGQKFTVNFTTLAGAEREYNSKLRSKTNKGYVEVDLATHSKGSVANKTTVEAKYAGSSNSESNLSPEISKIVARLYEEANKAVSISLNGEIEAHSSAPLGNLSEQTIDYGRRLLNKLGYLVDNGLDDEIQRFSIEYYKKIPRKMPSNLRTDRSWLLNTQDKLSKEMDILNLYEDSLRMLPAMLTNSLDSQYEALNCDIEYITDSKTLDYVRNKVEKTIAPNHNFRLRVKNVYAVKLKNEPEFDSSCGNVRNLFHGSRSCNLVGILSSHLKLPNSLPNVHKTGAMFGPGIYLANNSSKSFNYSDARFGGTKNKYDTAFLFLVETALGNVKKVEEAEQFRKAPAGYDSVMGCKGRRLLNDEFIVYKENQVRIKYLIEVEKY